MHGNCNKGGQIPNEEAFVLESIKFNQVDDPSCKINRY